MRDLMIDLETLGTGADAAIIQLGACYFDRKTGEIGRTLELNINLTSMIDSGAKMDPQTVLWWLQQSPEARQAVTADPRVDARPAMEQFIQFCQGAGAIWSHATFDFVIVQATLKRLNLKQLNYRSARDIRTLTDLAKLDRSEGQPRTGIHHTALADCLFQVQYCVACLNKLAKRLETL